MSSVVLDNAFTVKIQLSINCILVLPDLWMESQNDVISLFIKDLVKISRSDYSV